jgi:hypothetical protein
MRRYLFVGERPSPTAARRGWRWTDGRLCASTLFAALRAAGLNPERHTFANLFKDDETEPYWNVVAACRDHVAEGGVVVGMGGKVQRGLTRHGIPHVALIHPAARGAIRATERYQQHVVERLGPGARRALGRTR